MLTYGQMEYMISIIYAIFIMNISKSNTTHTLNNNLQRECDKNVEIFTLSNLSQIGGWTEELKIAEHADFFVKMKAAGNKVVYCEDIEVINQQETPEERSKSYQKLR